jgi:hypothetical protein
MFQATSFSNAKTLCDKRQMDLLKIETPAEQDLLSSFLSSQCVFKSICLNIAQSSFYHTRFGILLNYDWSAAVW